MSALSNGTLLQNAKFKIEDVLGQGGFGITYRAYDTSLNRQVAIKEYYSNNYCTRVNNIVTPKDGEEEDFERWRKKFSEEARIIAKFNKENIVTIYEVFEQFNTSYYVMELLDGRDAASFITSRGGPFPQDNVIEIATVLGDALDEVHRHNLLHRDVHPKNILITQKRVVLIDFGLAVTSLRSPHQQHTAAGIPAFMAPEMLSPDSEISHQTDVYSMAASMYYLLCAECPTPSSSRLGGTRLVPPHEINHKVNKQISLNIMKGMELDPPSRHASAGEFATALIEPVRRNIVPVKPAQVVQPQAQAQVISPTQATPGYQLTGEDYRAIGKGLAVGAITVAGLAAVAGGIWAWMEHRERKAPADQSEADQRLSAGIDHLLAEYPELEPVVMGDQDLTFMAITERLNRALPNEQQTLTTYEQVLRSAKRTARWKGTPFTKLSCFGWMAMVLIFIATMIIWEDVNSTIRAAAICVVVGWLLWAMIALFAGAGRGNDTRTVRHSEGIRDTQRRKVADIKSIIAVQQDLKSASQWRSFKHAISSAFSGNPKPMP